MTDIEGLPYVSRMERDRGGMSLPSNKAVLWRKAMFPNETNISEDELMLLPIYSEQSISIPYPFMGFDDDDDEDDEDIEDDDTDDFDEM